jgi:hypothetical protein
MIERDDTRAAWLDHPNLDTGSQPHFTEAAYQMRVAFDVGDATRFSRIEQLHRQDLHDERASLRQQSGLRLNLNRKSIVSDGCGFRSPFRMIPE